MTRHRLNLCVSVLLALCPAMVWAELPSQPATQPTSQSASGFIAYGSGSAEARTPGFHKLIYTWTEDGQVRYISFSIYLPQGYGQDDRRWPMLTFLAGLGDRGRDPGMGMAVGAPLEVGRSEELGKWLPMIILTPQCPSDKVWDSPGMAQTVLRLVHAAIERFSVDPSRLYVSGFSDGGKGSWVLAAEEPGLFAVTVPIVSREYNADQTAQRLAGTGITCLVLSGMKDPKSEPASAHMVDALRKNGVDVVYGPVPDAEHFIWRAFYSQRTFYEWLLLHRRGQAAPKDRATGEQFVELYTTHQQRSFGQQMFDHRLQRSLNLFEPYWFVDNCGESGSVGLQPRMQERRNVYVTAPLSADIPCRLQTTRQLSKDKWTDLAVEAGHPPKGEWELVVRVNEEEQSRTVVNDQTAPNGWMQVKVSLRPYAGKEARLQLIQRATGNSAATGYWASVKLIETNR